MSHTETNHARANTSAWMDTIKNYTLAMSQESWDRLEELKDAVSDEAAKLSVFRQAEAVALALAADEADELRTLTAALAEFQDAEDAREQAEQSALSLELAGTWEPGAKPEPDTYIITLTTGGPALRLTGSLGRYNQPEDAELEYQDWGTGWTRYCGENLDRDALLEFASIFYFGE